MQFCVHAVGPPKLPRYASLKKLNTCISALFITVIKSCAF